jgi:hypothetical protein
MDENEYEEESEIGEITAVVDSLILNRAIGIEDYLQLTDAPLEHKLMTLTEALTFEGKVSYASFLAREIAKCRGITKNGKEMAEMFYMFADTRDRKYLFDIDIKLGMFKEELDLRVLPIDAELFVSVLLASLVKILVLSFSSAAGSRMKKITVANKEFLVKEELNEMLASHAEVIRHEYNRTLN